MAAAAVGRRALVAGATGLVGRQLVPRLAADGRWSEVVALVRRPAGLALPGVVEEVADFERLEERPELFRCDALFCALGTTMRTAGSRAAFEAVDRVLVERIARLARAGGAEALFLVSSIGADPRARGFYLAVKGAAEEAVAALGYPALHVFRPSLLVGARDESRPGERVGIALARLARPLLAGPLLKYRAVEASVVAAAMVAAARAPEPGRHVHEHAGIVRLAGAAG